MHVDTRNCSACLVHNPFGGCVVRGNDPICEASKAAQNAGYATAKADCEAKKSAAKADCERIKGQGKLDCERLKTQEKAQCETEKEGQRLACETEKGAVVALHHTGNIGNVDGSVAGTGSLRLCFQDVDLSAALDKLTMTLVASGSAALGTHFKFVPLDVGGHILCPFEWTADKVTAQPGELERSQWVGKWGWGRRLRSEAWKFVIPLGDDSPAGHCGADRLASA